MAHPNCCRNHNNANHCRNVIAYETEPDQSAVAAMAPIAALCIVGENRDVASVAGEANQRLSPSVAVARRNVIEFVRNIAGRSRRFATE